MLGTALRIRRGYSNEAMSRVPLKRFEWAQVGNEGYAVRATGSARVMGGGAQSTARAARHRSRPAGYP